VWRSALQRYISAVGYLLQHVNKNCFNAMERYTDPLLYWLQKAYSVVTNDAYDSCDEQDSPFIRVGSKFYRVKENARIAFGSTELTSSNARCQFVALRNSKSNVNNHTVDSLKAAKLLTEVQLGERMESPRRRHKCRSYTAAIREVVSARRLLAAMIQRKILSQTSEVVGLVRSFCSMYVNFHRFITRTALQQAGVYSSQSFTTVHTCMHPPLLIEGQHILSLSMN
jgi:hypothetical protein